MLNTLLIIVLIVVLLPYITPVMSNDVKSLLNNTVKVLDVGSGMAVGAAANVSGGVAFASEGKNPLSFI